MSDISQPTPGQSSGREPFEYAAPEADQLPRQSLDVGRGSEKPKRARAPRKTSITNSQAIDAEPLSEVTPVAEVETTSDDAVEASALDVARQNIAEAKQEVVAIIERTRAEIQAAVKEAKASPAADDALQAAELTSVAADAVLPNDEAAQSETEAPLVSDAEYELKPTPLRRLLAAERRIQKELDAQAAKVESDWQESSVLAETLAEDANRLAQWHSEIEGSFIAKVKSRMLTEVSLAETDLATHRANVENIQVMDEGTLVNLRKTFHHDLGRASRRILYWAVPLALLALMPVLPMIFFLSDLYDKKKSWPWILIMTGAVITALVLLRKWLGKELLTKKRIAKLSVFAAICLTILALLPFISPWLLAAICPWIGSRIIGIMATLFFAFLVSLFVLLTRYYSGWSKFRRDVQLQIMQLHAVIEGYIKTQQEVKRLNLLHQQTADWVEIIANAVYRPWKTNPMWGSDNEYAAHYETFPLAMRVAQAKEVNDSKMVALENNIARRLLIQGWRNKAFEDLVEQAGIEMGMDPERFNVELLDSDLPHQSNNSRALIRRFLDYSAQNPEGIDRAAGLKPSATASTVVDASNAYLVEVAKSRLLDLIEKAQSDMFTNTRPRVEQIIDDELEPLRVDMAGVDTYDPSQDWDEFLRESLGGTAIEEVPLGPLTFTVAGRTAQANEIASPDSYILVPSRVKENLPPVINSEKIKVVPFVDDKPRAVEIVARIDVVGPLPFQAFTVLGSSRQGDDEQAQTPEPKKKRGRDQV